MKQVRNPVRQDVTSKAPFRQSRIAKYCAAEFKVLRLRECPMDNPILDNPKEICRAWRELVEPAAWFKPERECMVVFLLNTRNRMIGFEMLSQGTANTILVNKVEVFRLAVIQCAQAIVIAHNHPSGEPAPSEGDIVVTRDLLKGSRLLNVDLMDHVIIGSKHHKHRYVSLRELGYFYN